MSKPYHHKYTGRERAYVRVSIRKLTTKQMAEHIGVRDAALRKAIYTWRKEGYNIPQGKTKDIGTVTTRIKNGRQVAFIKTGAGWRVKDSNKPPNGCGVGGRGNNLLNH